MGSTSGLALRRISGHCTITAEKIHAWYLLDPQGWSFRPDAVREQMIIDGADAFAQLANRQSGLSISLPGGQDLEAWRRSCHGM